MLLKRCQLSWGRAQHPKTRSALGPSACSFADLHFPASLGQVALTLCHPPACSRGWDAVPWGRRGGGFLHSVVSSQRIVCIPLAEAGGRAVLG